ncbi:transporter [Ferruginivarius sediminum]|uniref:Transporter n=1 Tax=Ferruginivarius sediminum TaxID=2661937 RepID=A0A369T7K9_9PROT|nr:transporter [Ferruginivarius sediminum]RDD61311.1 hypothetical protein DRB17_13655 [Ferruginivarius sediminum]
MFRYLLAAVAVVPLALPLYAQASCGSAFCTVNTDWDAQSPTAGPGTRVDLRYEYIKQDQPRHHTKDVDVGELPRHHDEVETINHNIVATVDHTFDENWGASIALPFVKRDHEHIHNHHGSQIFDSWDFSKLGDMQVLGRYKFSLEQDDPAIIPGFGLNFGLELPTGEFHVKNDDGELAERSLQPGSGTVDLLLGAFYQQTLLDWDSSWFVQGQFQQPLHQREDYEPGWEFSVDVGYRYNATEDLGLLLQLNTAVKGRDHGDQAEPEDTGSALVAISPGISYSILDGVQVYGLVQQPVYEWVRGVQLTADWSTVVGVTTRF